MSLLTIVRHELGELDDRVIAALEVLGATPDDVREARLRLHGDEGDEPLAPPSPRVAQVLAILEGALEEDDDLA